MNDTNECMNEKRIQTENRNSTRKKKRSENKTQQLKQKLN